MLKSVLWYLIAALCEIGGCFAFWAWLRMNRGPLWALPGVVSLVVFALALTHIDAAAAGRAYAAYGGIYILSALAWLWLVEGVRPDRWDLLGAATCLVGAAIILHGPRGHRPADVTTRTRNAPDRTLPPAFPRPDPTGGEPPPSAPGASGAGETS